MGERHIIHIKRDVESLREFLIAFDEVIAIAQEQEKPIPSYYLDKSYYITENNGTVDTYKVVIDFKERIEGINLFKFHVY